MFIPFLCVLIILIKCERIRTIRERHGVHGGVRVEEVLLFEGRTMEKVDGYTRILEEMWAERGRLIESK